MAELHDLFQMDLLLVGEAPRLKGKVKRVDINSGKRGGVRHVYLQKAELANPGVFIVFECEVACIVLSELVRGERPRELHGRVAKFASSFRVEQPVLYEFVNYCDLGRRCEGSIHFLNCQAQSQFKSKIEIPLVRASNKMFRVWSRIERVSYSSSIMEKLLEIKYRMSQLTSLWTLMLLPPS